MARHLRTEGLDPSRALARESLPPLEIVPFPDPDAPLDDDDLGDPLDLTDDDRVDGAGGGRRHIGWLLPTMAVTAVITAVALAVVALIDPTPGAARNRPVVAGASITRPSVSVAPSTTATRPQRPAPSSIPPLSSTTVAPTTAPPTTAVPTTAAPTTAAPTTAAPLARLYRDPDGAFTVTVEATPRRSTRQLDVDGAAVTQRVTKVALTGGGEASIDVLPFTLAGMSPDQIDQVMRNYGAGTRPWGGAAPVFGTPATVDAWRQVDGTAGSYRMRVYAAADRLHLVWTATPGAAFDALLASYRPAA